VITSEFEQSLENDFDSNSITPGTEFMERVTTYLKHELKEKIMTTSDPLYTNISIIYSDWTIAGEGEHKLMDFIRNQHELYPNQEHCIFGNVYMYLFYFIFFFF
jgi:5'-3' exoribonuclease 1